MIEGLPAPCLDQSFHNLMPMGICWRWPLALRVWLPKARASDDGIVGHRPDVQSAITSLGALSGLNFGVELFEFCSGVFELELPIDAVLFFLDQVAISDWRNLRQPVRRPARHWLVRQLRSHSAMFNQLPCLGV